MAAQSRPMVQYAMYLIGVLWVVKQWRSGQKQARGGSKGGSPKEGKGGEKKEAYKDFNKDLRKLLKIAFKNYRSQEAGIMYAFIFVLLARTLLSLVVGQVDGFVVKQLINKDRKGILNGLWMWLAIALPSSLINSMIKYLQSRLALGVRARLTEYLRGLYFTNENYFRISHLDKRVSNPEHALTEDVAQWADRLAELLSSLGKPLVDLTFFSAVLFKNLGFLNQFIASVVVWETGKFLKHVRPNYSAIVQKRGTLEANLRLQHNRVILASEEIAFCSGDKREKNILKQRFDEVVNFTASFLRKQILYHTSEDFVTKYLWTAVGLVQVAIPLLRSGTTAGDNAKYFITVRRMMIRNGDATERLMMGIKDVAEFAGFTQRLMGMIKVFEEQSIAKNEVKGHVEVGDSVIVEDLPIVTPTKDVLIDKISFQLAPGDRLLILGPNGCGKSSLFRILCGLWPMMGGSITKPLNRSDLYFIPQKPYLVQGTFRDQIIYPETVEEMRANGKHTDEELVDILGKVLLKPVLEAHGGLDTQKEWAEVLSGGEKQRLGLARVLYHQPRYAILDEVSSAINVEAEQEIFTHLTALENMSIITISHRHTLFKFHNKLLTFDGEGHWEFNDHLQQTQLSNLSEQKTELMKQLSTVLKTLGEDWPKTNEVEAST